MMPRPSGRDALALKPGAILAGDFFGTQRAVRSRVGAKTCLSNREFRSLCTALECLHVWRAAWEKPKTAPGWTFFGPDGHRMILRSDRTSLEKSPMSSIEVRQTTARPASSNGGASTSRWNGNGRRDDADTPPKGRAIGPPSRCAVVPSGRLICCPSETDHAH